MPMNESILFWIILSIGISLSVGILAYIVLRDIYVKQRNILVAFFFMLSLSIPILGVISSLWLIYYFRTHQKNDHGIEYKVISTDPYFIAFPNIQRQFGDGAVLEVLGNENGSLVKRMTALTMLSENRSKENMQIIRQMLASPNDEIRLLSFAAIDNIEGNIHRKIHEENIRLETSQGELSKVNIYRSLAFAYWELIYFDLADEVLKRFFLEKVERYTQKVLSYFPNDVKMTILLGKTYFERWEDDKAERTFKRVIKLHKDLKSQSEFIYSYLAEIYFHQRRFLQVKETISDSNFFELVPKLKPIKELWTK